MKALLSLFIEISTTLLPFLKTKEQNLWISSLSIIVANGFVFLGVAFLGWSPLYLLLIYWSENLIIGLFNIPKMLMSGFFNTEGHFDILGLFLGLFFTGFFIIHYGGFTAAHGFFLGQFIYNSQAVGAGNGLQMSSAGISELLTIFPDCSFSNPLGFLESEYLAFIILLVSHGISFKLNFLDKKKYFHTFSSMYMIQPYSRVIVMHVTIIIGAILYSFETFRNFGFIFVWIALKIYFDLRSHYREHTKSTKDNNRAKSYYGSMNE